ncbi:Nucleoside phosphorylase domain [Fusarium oxysporum f. sp. vasinfectum]|nr:Nucleoside phosphorylase domain [Fusarium oxysporum f. sp. vasinfectum]
MNSPDSARVPVNPPDTHTSSAKSYPSRPSDRRGFEIAIICALALEADAIEALFDHHWEADGPPFDKEPGDPNAYSTGVIGRFNVVLAHMPGMGKVHAATVASNCGKSFPSIKLALVVGICGVVPFGPAKDEIILGDVIISNGVIQYDFGRQLPERFARKDTLLEVPGRPNMEIRGVLAKLEGLRHRRQLNTKIEGYLAVLQSDPELHAEYPGATKDRLFEASYRHTDDHRSCEQLGCNGELVSRSRLSTADVPTKPAIHFGLMASGDAVMKSGEDRDRIAIAEGIIAFEMEGAGVWDSFPCIIIKGGCDYADSHKSKVWQRYAAATAAACAKAFLGFWIPSITQDVVCLAANVKRRCSLADRECFDQRKRLAGEPMTQGLKIEQTVIPPQTGENATTESRTHYLPLSRNKNFVGRHEVISQLQQLLFTDPDGQRVALVGLGGIGKTQIALQLAHIVKKIRQTATTPKMISKFGIAQTNEENPKETFKRFLSSEKVGKWFLIIDNADNIETLYGKAKAAGGIDQFIPDCEYGYILYTTRSREVAVSVAQNNIVELSEMDDQDAKTLLKSSLIEKDQMQDTALIDRLLHELAYLPLAITQASAYMKVNEVSVKEYLHLLQNTEQDMVELLSCGFRDSTHYDSSQGAVATTWIVSFKQIRAVHEDAATILSIIAYLEPKAIPRALLPPLGSDQKMIRAVGTLCGYSFLTKREDGETFDMHSLVHLATQRWNEDDGLEIRLMAFKHIAKVFPTNDWENREIWRQYMPHALRLLTNTDDGDTKDRCVLGYWVGGCLLADGRIRQAVHILESVVELQRTTLAENDRKRLESQHALAIASSSNGQTKEAIELLKHVVVIEADLAENHPHRLASQHALAATYQSNGQIKEAVELFEHVVAVEADILPENHPDRLMSQHELALAYGADGQVKEAIELLEHVVAVRASILSEDHPNRLVSEAILGIVYQNNGQTKEAIEMLEHVVAVQAVKLSEDHPDRQLSSVWLQSCYDRLEEVSVSGESDGLETDD